MAEQVDVLDSSSLFYDGNDFSETGIYTWVSTQLSESPQSSPSPPKSQPDDKNEDGTRINSSRNEDNVAKVEVLQLFVGNIPYMASEDAIQKMFLRFGRLVQFKFQSNTGNMWLPRYAFITYDNIESIRQCLMKKDTFYWPENDLDGEKLNVNVITATNVDCSMPYSHETETVWVENSFDEVCWENYVGNAFDPLYIRCNSITETLAKSLVKRAKKIFLNTQSRLRSVKNAVDSQSVDVAIETDTIPVENTIDSNIVQGEWLCEKTGVILSMEKFKYNNTYQNRSSAQTNGEYGNGM